MKKYKPDGYMVIHYGQNFTADFGPFSFQEAKKFVETNQLGRIIPLFKTVDWERDSQLRRGTADLDILELMAIPDEWPK